MWKRLSLRARIFLLLTALVGATLTGGLVTLWHTRAMNGLLVSLIDQNLASLQAAEELTNSLLNQKGFLTYYFLDGNPDWLKQMEQYREDFGEWLQKARKSAYTEPMAQLLRQIDAGFGAYVQSRQQVIDLYRVGQREAGARLHQELRRQFAALLQLCERYKLMHEQAISRVLRQSQTQARFINA
ncbi:MAG: MCP four helix bundle domain-containing protein, partial [Desulfobaccales bacterium]